MTPLDRLTAIAAVAIAMATLAVAATATTAAHAAATCKLGSDGRKLGPSYVTSLTVTRTTCVAAKRLVRAYHRCRVAAGGPSGKCTHHVRGYRCSEKREGISVQFDATVTCRKGSARVRHTYTQNT